MNFGRDRNPEKEIRSWERITTAYEKEVATRGSTTALERGRLLAVIVMSSMGMSASEIVSSRPDLKAFPGVERASRVLFEG